MAQVTACGLPRLQQDARHHGADPKAKVGRHPPAQFHRGTPGDDLFDAMLGQVETVPGPQDLAGNRRIIGRFGGLPLVGVQHDQVHQMPRHPHVMRTQRPRRRQPLDLRNHQTTVIAHRNRLIQTAQRGALMLIGQVAPLIRRCGAQNADVGHDVGKVQPGLTTELHPLHDGRASGPRVHRTALAYRVDKGLQANFGQHPGLSGRHIAVHVEQDARRHVIGRNPVLGNHAPDFGHRQVGTATGIRPPNHPRQQPILCDMVDALDAVHVAGCNRVQRGQSARMAGIAKPLAQGRQHLVRAAQRRRRRNRHHSPVGDTQHSLGCRYQFSHASPRCSGRSRHLERSNIYWNVPDRSNGICVAHAAPAVAGARRAGVRALHLMPTARNGHPAEPEHSGTPPARYVRPASRPQIRSGDP